MEKFNATVTDTYVGMKTWFDIKNEEGAGMVEYGLLVVLIALVALVGIRLAGQEVDAVFDDVTTELQSR